MDALRIAKESSKNIYSSVIVSFLLVAKGPPSVEWSTKGRKAGVDCDAGIAPQPKYQLHSSVASFPHIHPSLSPCRDEVTFDFVQYLSFP